MLSDVHPEVVGVLGVQFRSESPHHLYEVLDLTQARSFDAGGRGQVVGHEVPNADVAFGRFHKEPIHGGFADAAGGVVDDALQRFVVPGVGREPKIGDQILDLLALVKRQASVNAVRHVQFAQAFLK